MPRRDAFMRVLEAPTVADELDLVSDCPNRFASFHDSDIGDADSDAGSLDGWFERLQAKHYSSAARTIQSRKVDQDFLDSILPLPAGMEQDAASPRSRAIKDSVQKLKAFAATLRKKTKGRVSPSSSCQPFAAW